MKPHHAFLGFAAMLSLLSGCAGASGQIRRDPSTILGELDSFVLSQRADMDDRPLIVEWTAEPKAESVLVTLGLQAEEGHGYGGCFGVTLVADGHVVKQLGSPEHHGKISSTGGTEYVMLVLPSDSVYELARAKSVQGRVCHDSFELSEDQISEIARFARVTQLVPTQIHKPGRDPMLAPTLAAPRTIDKAAPSSSTASVGVPQLGSNGVTRRAGYHSSRF